MKVSTAILALAATAAAAPLDVNFDADVEQASAAKVCASSGLCYNEYASASGVSYRVAIPSTATAAPYDIAIQIVAPIKVGWAGISWGGSMANAPLTVGWANGKNVTVSSRMATGYKLPGVYAAATYTVLPDNGANATHWTLSALCKGCSSWSSKSVPLSASAPLAWASSSKPVTTPADPASSFSIHDNKGKFTFDMTAAKQENFATATAPKSS